MPSLSLRGELLNRNALAEAPVLALGSPSVPSRSPFARSNPFPSVSAEGRGALWEEGDLVLGLPPGSQPSSLGEGEEERGREGGGCLLQMELLITL